MSFSRFARRSCPRGCVQAGKIPGRKSLAGSLGKERGEKFSLPIKMITVKGFFQAVFWLGEAKHGHIPKGRSLQTPAPAKLPFWGKKLRKRISSFK